MCNTTKLLEMWGEKKKYSEAFLQKQEKLISNSIVNVIIEIVFHRNKTMRFLCLKVEIH